MGQKLKVTVAIDEAMVREIDRMSSQEENASGCARGYLLDLVNKIFCSLQIIFDRIHVVDQTSIISRNMQRII